MMTADPEADAKPYRTETCLHAEIEGLAQALENGGDAPGKECFTANELAKAAGFRAPKRRKDWLSGRLAAKRLLARRWNEDGLKIREGEIELLAAADGMPDITIPGHFADARRYPLSITHSNGIGMAVIGAPGTGIGIDLEMVEKREGNFLDLVAHESERSPALASDPFQQTRLWTLKEAVTKVLGTGMSVGFYDARFREDDGRIRVEFFREALRRWEALGSPEIFFDCETSSKQIVTVAYTKRAASAIKEMSEHA